MKKLAVATALFLLVAAATTCSAEDRWGEKLFNGDLVCDFGTVAHGAELYHPFKITNIYQVPLDIADLRVSCGCVTATAAQKTLQPKESTIIEARMDTTRFTGVKAVSIYVSIAGKGYSSSAELKVSANIRQDVVFNPGQIDLGAVNQGETVSRKIDIDYAGALAGTWQITEVMTNNAPVETSIKEIQRNPGRVGYQAVITLKKDAPVGALKQEIFFKTNDPSSPLVPAFVLATIQAPVTVTPGKLSLGTIGMDSEVVMKVVVRANKPVKIISVEGSDEEASVEKLPTETADNHRLTIHCKPGHTGDFKRVLKIHTDGQDAPVEVLIEGSVQQ